LRQEDHELKASPGYTVRPCLKMEKRQKSLKWNLHVLTDWRNFLIKNHCCAKREIGEREK
jgi:hypothetical protein